MALVAYLEHKLSLVDVLHISDNFGRGLRFLLIPRRLRLVEVICEVEGWERTLFGMTCGVLIFTYLCAWWKQDPFFGRICGFLFTNGRSIFRFIFYNKNIEVKAADCKGWMDGVLRKDLSFFGQFKIGRMNLLMLFLKCFMLPRYVEWGKTLNWKLNKSGR